MDDISLVILSAIFGGLMGSILSLLTVRWSTLKTVKSAEEGLRTQLLFEEKKKSLKELRRLVDQKYDSYPSFKQTILAFLDTLEADFLPMDLRDAIRTEIYQLDKFMEDSGLVPSSEPDDEINLWFEAAEEAYQELSSWEKAEVDFKERLGAMKGSIRKLISDHIKP
jgi:hypothetical protein